MPIWKRIESSEAKRNGEAAAVNIIVNNNVSFGSFAIF